MEGILSPTVFYCIGGALVLGILIGLSLMSRVKTARAGNTLSAVCALIAILVTMYNYQILSAAAVWISIAIGAVISLIAAARIKMIQMPQAVALLNGLGGLASALVAVLSFVQSDKPFPVYTALVALVIGALTFSGSLIAAGKLHKVLPQKPVVWKGHTAIIVVTLLATLVSVIFRQPIPAAVLSLFFGVAFAIRVGGADMPITISLLNSLSGVAGGIAGIAVGDTMLVAIGGIVGASGLLLTQIMCRAMNRKLIAILLGSTSAKPAAVQRAETKPEADMPPTVAPQAEEETPGDILRNAKKVILVPGYGMALAQAQSSVKQLADKLEANGADVKFAIHPVAGRMPGHMNVLLCEVDVPYDKLYEMDAVNDEFAQCDAAVVVGANDVVNPAANTAEGTPIYGMPVLNVADAKHVIICNFDTKPGYAGVPNPLYEQANTTLLLGDAKETVRSLTDAL